MAENHKTVLIIENSPAQALALEHLLKAEELQVRWAADGQSGVTLAQQHAPDVIIFDVEMPSMDSSETCRCLKKNAQTADIPIVMFTVRDNAAMAMHGIDLGAIDFIPKDTLSGPVLLETLRQLHILPGSGRLEKSVQIAGGRSTIVDVINRLCADASDDRAGEIARQSKQAHTVLVVEDDEDISHLIALQLRCEGFEVLTTAYGKEAVSLVNSRHIDLITLDMMLPDISGTEVLHQIKANPETAAIPVIIVSVLLPEQTGDAEQGAADYIIKPFAFETLMKSIRRTLAASQQERPAPL